MAKLIGTAGHVDHGKTTLIHALTGIDADRLPEEKARGLTIDLGFAYLDLPQVGRVSIVDVPGHERYVTNMLVGALGIDVALLCVAADESVMPQTKEHFAILTVLPVEKLVVALTRSDLVDEAELELAREDVTRLLEGTRFEESEIIGVSAFSGAGLESLKQALARSLAKSSTNGDGPWSLPIDRVFTVKGHGAVVTGTLTRGSVRVGEEAQIEPGHVRARVRQVQSHDVSVETAERGQRVALNLSGIKEEELRRGLLAGSPGTLFATEIIDALIEWVGAPKHGERVRVAIGADEAIGKLFLNDHDKALAQIRFERPVGTAIEQPLVIRRYSPPELLGGGRVLVPEANRRRKGQTVDTSKGVTLADTISNHIKSAPDGVSTEEICRKVGLAPQALGDTFEDLLKAEGVVGFAGMWFTPDNFGKVQLRLSEALEECRRTEPQRLLFPRDIVVKRAGAKWSGKPLDRMLAKMAEDQVLRVRGTEIGLRTWVAHLNPAQRQLIDRVKEQLDAAGASVPSPADVARSLHVPLQAVQAVLNLGIDAGETVRLADDIWYSVTQLERLVQEARQHFGDRRFAASEFRDFTRTSRKYTIPLLEYLDAKRVTLRQGDLRIFV